MYEAPAIASANEQGYWDVIHAEDVEQAKYEIVDE